MEILYWFLFFSLMIFISFFSWSELFFGFIMTTMISGGFFNYENYSISDNWFLRGISVIVYLISIFCKLTNSLWNKFTTYTYIGIKFKSFFIYLENNYQQIKGEIKKQVLLNMMGNMNLSNTILKGTPRLSYDTEDTEDE